MVEIEAKVQIILCYILLSVRNLFYIKKNSEFILCIYRYVLSILFCWFVRIRFMCNNNQIK